MKPDLMRLLHLQADLRPFAGGDALPLFLRSGYEFEVMQLAGIRCLLAKPKVELPFVEMKKHREQLARLVKMECVLVFEALGTYRQQRLIEEAIPFIVEGRQVHLPFLGVVLEKEREAARAAPSFGPTTQRLILTAIHENWRAVPLLDATNRLHVSRMTVSRCFEELEALKLDMTDWRGREHRFRWGQGRMALWNAARPHLADPVLRTYRLEDPAPPKGGVLGGMSAVSRHSDLADNPFMTYAVTRTVDAAHRFRLQPSIPSPEIPGKLVQVLPGWIPFGDGTTVDPLTAILSLSEEERSEPRVERAIRMILEEVLRD